MLAALAELVVADLEGITGTVEVAVRESAGADSGAHRVVVEVGGGQIALIDPDGAAASAVLELDAETLGAVIGGEADVALAYLAGAIELTGDAALVLALGTRVRRAASGAPLIDPAALDPEAASRAVAGVPAEHLESVMAGAFRELILGEVFRRFPEFLIVEKAADVALAAAFNVAGGEAAGSARYVVRIDRGECEVVADPGGDLAAEVTLHLGGAQFLQLVLGHLNPVRAVLSGAVRVEGQLMRALALNSVLRIPGS